MASHVTRITPSGVHHGRLHPEIADLAQEVMRRDLRALRRHGATALVRHPYRDLDEVTQLAAGGWNHPHPPVAVIVTSLTATENARIPAPDEATVTAWLERSPRTPDLRKPRQPKGRGFA